MRKGCDGLYRETKPCSCHYEEDALREQNKALEESLEKMTEDRERWANSACRLEKTIEQRDRMKKALENAVDLITFEYCSHSEPHSATLTTCYAKEQLAALHYKETK